jgi:amino acid adenylation domain-containing protein
LTRHPAVAQAAVLVREVAPGDRRLVAYVVPAAGELPVAELREWLAERLPAYLIPGLVAVAALPLNASGKVDRRALEQLAEEAAPATAEREALDAPRTQVEELIAAIWAEVLGVERVGIHDDFFSLGGHSLLATRAVSRIVDTLHVDLPLSTFFEAPTVAGLAERLFGTGSRPEAPPLVPVPRTEPLPLSFAQQRIWFLDRLAPGGSAYNIAVAALLEGDLDVVALERSLGEIVRRHEALRTVFAEIEERPVQVVQPWTAPVLARRELLDLERARREAARDAAQPFDLGTGPVVRFVLTKLGFRQHLLSATFHHIAADGWSLQVFLRELAELYGARVEGRKPELPEPPVQYADYAVWQRQALSDQALVRPLAFWRWRLAGLEPIELPADSPRTLTAAAPARTRPLDLPDDLAAELAAYAREAGATPFMVLLAGVDALLARLTGQRDLTVGAPVAARHRTEIEGLIGFFANTLPLRSDLRGDPRFDELVARVRTVVLEAHAHGDVPFERLVEELQPERVAGRNPLFDVVLAYLSTPAGRAELPGLTLEPVDLPGAEAKFDLSFTIHEREGALSGTLEGRGDLFEEATLGRMAVWLRTLLTGALAESATRLSDLPLLSPAERAELLALARTEGVAAEPALLHELFEERARQTPDAPALKMDGQTVSYAELNTRADRLAERLRGIGVGPEERVAVVLERSVELMVALLGVLKAGGAYVPIDPESPQERIDLLLADAGARVLITPEGAQSLGGTSPAPPAVAVDPRNAAYVIYTSGSTGRPKGVMVDHATAVAHLRTVIATYGHGPESRILFFASPSFDVSLEQMLPGLLAGATVVLRGRELWEPADLARRIDELGITFLNLPTAYWSRWVREAADLPAAPASLRLVLVGGEEMPAESARLWRRSALAAVPLLNGYGPTETVITATLHEIGDEAPGPVSIGRPLPGRAAYVLDPDGGLVPPGARGELALGGVLARGYLGAPDRTAERFVPNPFGEGRLYRTGDLVRRRAAGELEFLGRIDTQLKVRGFRVEAGEIEALLLEHPAVREAAVQTVGDTLAAWIALDPKSDIQNPKSELRSFLAGRLPAWMIPATFTLLPALPLTTHGKVDRRALPRPSLVGAEEGWTAPRNAVEEALAAVWMQVLGAERVGAHDDFFHLGGHSLLATQLAARVRAVFGVELPLSELFEAPTLAGMAERIEVARSAGWTAMPPLIRRPHPGAVAPLSFAQQRLWFLHQLEPDSPAYHVSGALRLAGPLRPDVLERALGEIVHRHEALRTVFFDTEAGPMQRILPAEPFPLPLLDLRGAADPAAEAEALGLAEARRLFDLAAGPVLRATLLRLADEEHLLVVVMHHVASDGWSLGVMIGELAALYAAFAAGEPSPLPELAVQYADFAEWQRRTLRGRYLERQLAWWREQLAVPPVLDLPGDHPRPPVPSGRGASLPVGLPADLTRDLHALARAEGATLYMVLLAAFGTLLGRVSGQDDLTVGSPIANRDRQEIEPLIGCFVNTLTMRVRLAGDPGFRELLARVREVTLGAYDHQGVPFERLVEELAAERDRAHAPLFQVMLVLQNAPLPPLRMGELVLERRELPTGTAKFDLTLALAEEEGGIGGALEHSTDLFESATAARLMGHLAELLRGAAAEPARPLSALPLLTAGERRQILEEWNATTVVLPGGLCLPDLVAAQAARTPQAQAVVGWRLSGVERLTYAELLARADRLAARLVALGVGPEARVGVCLERTVDLPVALLAVLRAGGAYVPLDPAYPRERLEFMLRDSGAGVLITQSDLDGRCGPFAGVTLRIDRLDRSDRFEVPTPALPGNLAYLIYTSGSTGVPKAVAIEHRSAVAMVQWALGEFSAEELAGVLFATSVCFDLSVFELFVPLASGGKVLVAANALELPSLPFAGEVTLVNTVPSAMTELAQGDGFPASVRTVNLAGEPLKGSLVDAAYALPGVRRVANLYGPSEDTTYSTGETVPPLPERHGEPLIGRPIANTRVYLVDQAGTLVPEGVPGELFLAGEGLARGYLGRPELTSEKFVPDPFGAPGARLYRTGDLARWRPGGRLEYLGRIDHQVKVRGFRIELGEIEAALARHPAVAEAVVLARDDEGRGKVLVAFLVRREGMETADLRPTALRQHLKRTLPEHMVPGAYVELPALPLTPNGKVDRRTLGRLRFDAGPRAGRGAVAPRTPTEELLAALWCEVLGRERVGVHDSFFELGGHSLLATRLVSRVRATFGRDLPLARLFEAPTVAEVARLLDEARGGVARSAPILPVPRTGDLPLSFAQERLWFLDRIQPGAAYSVPLALRLRGALDPARLGAAFGAIVARQEVLRTVFIERDGEAAQRIQAPPESWPLPVVDLSGLEGAEALAARISEEDSLRPFDLAMGPLLRTLALRLGPTDHVLLLNMHHIVSDGWSLGVLLSELAAFYGGTPQELPELPVQYADFAVWQKEWLRGQELERQMGYWRQQLAGAPSVLDLPTDRPRPLVATTNGARRPVALSAGLTARLAALGREQGATLFMVLLAAWGTLLHRFSRQTDLNVGTPIAGRNRSETEHLVGFFVNTLVLREDLTGDPLFSELVAQVRRTALAAYDHQDLPFEKLVDELRLERDMSHQPLFQVMFALQNAPLGALELPGLTLEPTDLGASIAKFDLTLNLMELSGVLGGSLEYNTDLFDATTAARLVAHWGVLLEEIAARPARRVLDLPLLTAAERHQLTLEWADALPEPKGLLLHQLIERQADLRPEAPAVEYQDVRFTYGELESRANQLAWTLREMGVQPDTRVGLCVERSADMIIAMLGVLKAGAAYVPLDPAHPRERLAFMLRDSGARVLLTQERLLGHLPETPENTVRVLCLDRDWDEIARRPESRPENLVSTLNLAYVIYTSGSTGTPKGVLVPHEAVAAYSQVCSAVYGSGPGDRNLQFASISFDASVEEIYSALTRGATLVVRGDVQEGASEFLERCRDQGITLLQLPTAFWHQLVTAMEAESLRLPESIRVLFVGGEKMLAQRLVAWSKLVPPGFQTINAYGPTETTVATTLCRIPRVFQVHDDLREVPIGRALPYARAYVVDPNLRPVPIGVVGEILISGPNLSRGYLDRPDLTAERFIPDPFSDLWGEPGERLYRTGDLVSLLPGGLIEFIGRTDHQVKIRGYRIELGEIEAALAAHPALGEVVVLTRTDPSGDVQLAAYGAVKGEVAPAPAELRAWLEERLPSYMVPAVIQVLPSMPVNAQGKVDRRALERLAPRSFQAGERADFAPPRNELEAAIARVWREVFGVDEGGEGIGIHDNFFDAGGNSLLLVKLHSRLQKALERNFPLVEMFKHPTIAALAASLGAEAPAQPSLDKARARTDTRRESMRQLQQLREQRRRGR